MAFRKRNVVIARPSKSPGVTTNETDIQSSPGVRPSFSTSQPITSTGCSSLDNFLGGHGGLPLGSSIIVEESGTTDFAGALLKYYAAEGLCHGHVLHVAGVGGGWVKDLPGVADGRNGNDVKKGGGEETDEKMKIAWRYEGLLRTGERALPDRSHPSTSTASPSAAPTQEVPFCHNFDLTRRLVIPPDAKINHIAISPSPAASPFDDIIRSLAQTLGTSPPNMIHRLIVPTILSPALYPPHSSRPEHFLRFLHQLRSLLRQHSTNLTAMLSLPLAIQPRHKGVTRWAEILSDGVLELTPFPHLMDTTATSASTSGGKAEEQQPQGMLKVHKLPVLTERGEGGAGAGNSIGEDLAFTVSRRKFVIAPYALPPVEGDQEGQDVAGAVKAKDVEF